eukprot:scaffold132287_cov33-Prasinocladus_malaysianus.AAC.2
MSMNALGKQLIEDESVQLDTQVLPQPPAPEGSQPLPTRHAEVPTHAQEVPCGRQPVGQVAPRPLGLAPEPPGMTMGTSGRDSLGSDIYLVGPNLYYTDSCCEEQPFLCSIFPSLQSCTAVIRNTDNPVQIDVDDLRGPAHGSSNSEFQFNLAGFIPVNVTTEDRVKTAIQDLRNAATPVYGFDMEWQLPQRIRGSVQPRTATIQVARDQICYCPRSMGSWHPAYHAARVLLDRALTKVGCNINGDVLKLQKDFQVNHRQMMQSCIELTPMLRLAFPEEAGYGRHWSLQRMVHFVLHKHLPKENDGPSTSLSYPEERAPPTTSCGHWPPSNTAGKRQQRATESGQISAINLRISLSALRWPPASSGIQRGNFRGSPGPSACINLGADHDGLTRPPAHGTALIVSV